MSLPALRQPAFTVAPREGAFVVSFRERARVASWAIVRGGLTDAGHVVWVEVRDDELGPAVDARVFLAERVAREGFPDAVGLLTSRRLSSRVDVTVEEGGIAARCLATVGLGNALRAGDPPWRGLAYGTINVLVHVDAPLTDEGMLEANAIATEAKCAALSDAAVMSRHSGRLATGTGTDCTVMACPRAEAGARAIAYAGKYTPVGAAVGAAVERAVGIGIREWRRELAGIRRAPTLRERPR
jgi:adenosylcobinamide amidohydrolase